ncbi:hypothetical protein Athai_25090 [Actinocatenispora thailandica]|uniref:SseB protein N-terminal domain-containing protein n=1 Tax=Actinocatenispora thailandica TaxID=227318 RepID=A0A7R7DNU4_9ACTN|nr:hypothetical protein [Actinocatenispora thailandica]BCJ35006.1 hypothetical protein Athai_25090 [Actinocatenispora thailandica]
MTDWVPGTDFERALAATVEARDLAGYLDVLIGGELLLPLEDDVIRDNRWITFASGDTQAIASFTSGSAMTAGTDGKFTLFRKQSLADLVANWPNERWRLGVDVGLSIGAIFDLTQLRAALGIAAPPPAASPSAGAPPGAPASTTVPSIGTPPPAAATAGPGPSGVPVSTDPASGRSGASSSSGSAEGSASSSAAEGGGAPSVMQKVVPPDQVGRYLDDGYDLVAGYVYELADVEPLRTVSDIVGGLGLDYAGSPFSRDDEYVWVIRWRPVVTSVFRVPWGGTDAAALGAWGDRGWVVEHPPFAGNGFAVDPSTPIPEWKVDSTRITSGAELYRIDRTGRQDLVAVYSSSNARWNRLAGG